LYWTIQKKEMLRYLQIHPQQALPDLDNMTPFKAIVIVEEAVPETWHWEVCRWLAKTMCRHAVIGGRDCIEWAESLEDANMEAFDYEAIPDDRLLVVTAMEDEELEEVFWFAKHRATHSAYALVDAVILHVSGKQEKERFENAYEST